MGAVTPPPPPLPLALPLLNLNYDLGEEVWTLGQIDRASKIKIPVIMLINSCIKGNKVNQEQA